MSAPSAVRRELIPKDLKLAGHVARRFLIVGAKTLDQQDVHGGAR